MILISNIARLDVGVGSAINSFHTSDGIPSAPGALLFGVSASAPMILVQIMVFSHSGSAQSSFKPILASAST
ncbi:hypothetical protein AYI70_g7187, partial [Smittium culicis]